MNKQLAVEELFLKFDRNYYRFYCCQELPPDFNNLPTVTGVFLHTYDYFKSPYTIRGRTVVCSLCNKNIITKEQIKTSVAIFKLSGKAGLEKYFNDISLEYEEEL